MRRRGCVFAAWGVVLLRPGRVTAGRSIGVAEKKNIAVVSRALQTSSDVDQSTVINGVLQLLSTEAVSACDSKCEEALSAAFDVEESDVACLCPEARRRGLFSADGTRMDAILLGRHNNMGDAQRNPRSLRGLAEEDEGQGAAFAARVPGGLSAGVSSLDAFVTNGRAEVASAFGVPELEVWCLCHVAAAAFFFCL